MNLSDPIEKLPRTHSITFKRFKSLDINTIGDLIGYFPSRYENYSVISPINRLQEGETVTIKGEVVKTAHVFTKHGKRIQKIYLQDNTGQVELVWYNQPFILQTIKKGMYISVSGEVKKFLNTYTLTPQEYEAISSLDQPTIHTGKIIPIYPEKKGLSSKIIRDKLTKVFYLLSTQTPSDVFSQMDILPEKIISFNNLIPASRALPQIHFPDSVKDATDSRKRLSFDEFFVIQLSASLIKKQWQKETVSKQFSINPKIKAKIDTFIKKLPFTLTDAQKRVIDEVFGDLSKNNPMNRFLQGDVGSGKTVVAALGAYVAHLNGYQTLIMVPTEILAHQHFATLTKLFQNTKVTLGIQTGSVKSIKKDEKNNFDILVGTHALLNEKLSLEKVGFIVIDEQHRFGVKQRAQLKQKGINPHLLTMTATPIPRTVALTLYGELDLSVIDEMPLGRLPIKTYLVPHAKRDDGYEWVRKQIKQESVQVYIICPLIEESESETMQTVKAATIEYENLKNNAFKDFKVALLHGRMKPKEKEIIMREFKEKKYDILVSTSVVEVGIDIPNATIMIIEGAERFGLAQLHQLRGRIGRGDKQSYCYLFTSTEDTKNTERLRLFARTTNGNELAEYDLKIRGSGNIFGVQQHGYIDLKIANFGDFGLIKASKGAVNYFMEHYELQDFPALKNRIESYRIDQITRD